MSSTSTPNLDVAIVGAGPYGLSIAAHLHALGASVRIFGQPMLSWQEHMPRGMFLKSEGFASNLYDPLGSYTLSAYCAELGLPYSDIGTPVPIDLYIRYGLAFQKRFVPFLERTNIQLITKTSTGFEITTAEGESLCARNVIVAAGITHFRYLPPELFGHSPEFVTHSYDHADFSRFRDCTVAVIGAGSSAIDIAASLHEANADVKVIARRESVAFHGRAERRSLIQNIISPRSGLGIGWRSWLCVNAPLVFHFMPAKLRARVVERHLGPSSGWFMKDRVVGRFPLFLGSAIVGVKIRDGKACLSYKPRNEEEGCLVVDHIIGATGYRVDVERLGFIEDGLRRQIRRQNGSPILDTYFESSVKGLYLTGVASANSFGPLMRFALGAKFTARRLAKRFKSVIGRRGQTT
jgi:hypothetical protein